MSVMEISQLEAGTTIQVDGQQNFEYLPGSAIYQLIPRHMSLKPPGAISRIQLAVALMQTYGITTVFRTRDYEEFVKQFEPEEYTDEAVKEVGKAAGILAVASYLPKAIRGVKALIRSAPQFHSLGAAIRNNYGHASTAPSTVGGASYGKASSLRLTNFSMQLRHSRANAPAQTKIYKLVPDDSQPRKYTTPQPENMLFKDLWVQYMTMGSAVWKQPHVRKYLVDEGFTRPDALIDVLVQNNYPPCKIQGVTELRSFET